MPIFQPPTAHLTPLVPPGTRGLAAKLLRHFGSLRKGISVLQQADGSWITQEYPTQEQIDSSLRHYLGGHVYTITEEEVVLLTAAGYGEYIT